MEPPPGQSPDANARNWGMFCHLAALGVFTGIPFGGIIGPLIVWMIKKDEFPFVDDQGRESLNFQITVAIAFFALGIVTVFGAPLIIPAIIGGIALFGLSVANLVYIILAALAASRGETWRYPYSLRLIQ